MAIRKIRSNGFTLIELLVVISIIALLLSILMPSLNKVKDHAKRIGCSTNLRSLATAAIVYAGDNDDLTPCSTNYWDNWTRAGWCGTTGIHGTTQVLPLDEQIYGNDDPYTGLQRGQLWPYVETIKVWRCPVDPEKKQLRSYCMAAQWWGQHTTDDDSVWYDDPQTTGLVYRKISKVKRAGQKFMYVDQLGYNTDAYAALLYSRALWWNIPNFLHDGGSINGFADGHSEYYKFSKETLDMAEEAFNSALKNHAGFRMPQDIPETEGGLEDLKYYQCATWGKLGW